ncbi:lysis protein [Citrobacter braakii]|uniref:lysis protein n=1 Tax=Citrobacter braakii TaxID=57706 RepID=UPI00253FEA57|nr:lysis protein [Citrobacter braakii]WIF78250.1 lysis protein [Citrobacter braakii]
MSRVTTIIISVVVCLLVSLGWLADHYRDNAITFKDQRDKARSELQLAKSTIIDMKTRQRDTAALDAKHTRELADAKAENDALRHKLDTGGRVLVSGKCPVPATDKTTPTSGVGDGTSVELSNAAGRNVLDIRAGIISDQQKVKYLQEYITTQCLK